MPTLSGSLTTVTGYGRSFLSCCDFWRIARIETDEDDLIVLPWVEGNLLQRVDDPLLQLTAQHWAVVVDKRKKHGFSSKVFAELDIARAVRILVLQDSNRNRAYVVGRAAAACSKIFTAFTTSATPKITNVALVPGSVPL
jgi:hypothetical protein